MTTRQISDFGFWLRWVAANAIGEIMGLTPVALAGLILARVLAEGGGVAESLIAMLVFCLLGAVEGTVVGLAQWFVLRRRLPAIKRRSWILATVIGAVAAWFLGMLPSTLGALTGGQSDPSAAGFGDVAVYVLAGAMGAVLGAVLALPQWSVLRHFVARSGWWPPANALAWAVAMPLLFLAAGLPLPQEGLAPLLAAVLGTIGLTGALVGAIHGAVLVWLTPAHPRA